VVQLLDWNLVGKFSRHVEIPEDPNECWGWGLSKTAGGYGQMMWYGKAGYAHRLSYSLFVGPIPSGLVIDHLCRNRGCVNPDHLEVVTNQENLRRGIHSGPPKKSHCPKGHPYSGDNLSAKKNGRKSCKACAREYYHRTKEWGDRPASRTY
jgi:hypothetical protein